MKTFLTSIACASALAAASPDVPALDQRLARAIVLGLTGPQFDRATQLAQRRRDQIAQADGAGWRAPKERRGSQPEPQCGPGLKQMTAGRSARREPLRHSALLGHSTLPWDFA